MKAPEEFFKEHTGVEIKNTNLGVVTDEHRQMVSALLTIQLMREYAEYYHKEMSK